LDPSVRSIQAVELLQCSLQQSNYAIIHCMLELFIVQRHVFPVEIAPDASPYRVRICTDRC
jgi:hypothetical protein